MNSFSFIRRNMRLVVVGSILMLIAAVPAIVSAAQIPERSISLSNSSAGMPNVSYDVKFTAVEAAGAYVVDFCANTPLIGQECTAPAGFVATNASTDTSGFAVSDLDSNTLVVTGEIVAGEVVTNLTGINNPSEAGPLYARIVTFDTPENAQLYTSQNIGTAEAVKDQGSVAVSITPTVGVSGAVLETLTFCVSKAVPTENCGNTDAPVLALGQQVGDTVALTDTVSEGTINTQISTNAASGAIIRLKSNALGCGGLLRAGAAPGTCDIKPAPLVGGIADNGEARFGLKLAAASSGVGSNANGTLRPFGSYNSSTYFMNYVNDNEGVTSTYGDPILDTNDEPVNNQNMGLTFGAVVSNDTPAGLYSADLSLIATGKF